MFLFSQIHNSLKARIISFFPLQKYLVSSNASYKMFENNKLSQPLPFFVSGIFHIEKKWKKNSDYKLIIKAFGKQVTETKIKSPIISIPRNKHDWHYNSVGPARLSCAYVPSIKRKKKDLIFLDLLEKPIIVKATK